MDHRHRPTLEEGHGPVADLLLELTNIGADITAFFYPQITALALVW